MDVKKSKCLVLVAIFLISISTNLVLSNQINDSGRLLDSQSDSMSSNGFHTSNAVLIQDFHVEEFTNQSPPYRWFKVYGQTETTYINLSSSITSYSWWAYGTVTAYTAYDACIYQVSFYLHSDHSFACQNPTSDPVIIVKIDFSSNQDATQSRLDENISLNVSVGHGVVSPPPPTLPTETADGDLLGDSTNSNSVQVTNLGTGTITVDGTFEWSGDDDHVSFSTHQVGNHQLSVKFNQSLEVTPVSGLGDCEYDYNNGFETFQSRLSSVGNPVEFNGGYVFSASTNSLSGGLWYLEDMQAQPVLLMSSENPYRQASNYIVYQNTVLFSAYDDEHGTELWRSDGTASGTWMVTDLRPGSSSSTPLYLTAHDNHIYFRATTPYGNNELHVSDGSAAGTYLLVDIGDYSSSDPFYFTSFGEHLFFRATDEMGRSEVWKSDGTAQGTSVLKTINPSYGSSPNWFIVAGDQLFFTATDPVYGSELWVTDGESSGTRMVRDISSGSSSTTVYPEATNSNSLYFFVYSGGNKEFWITDGTEAGTLQSPVVSSQLSIYSDVVRIDNAYYLIAINPTNSTTDLYKLVDGQPHSPTHLATLVVNDHPSIVELFEADDDLYFRSRYLYSTTYRSYHLDTPTATLSPVDFGPMDNVGMGSLFLNVNSYYSFRSGSNLMLFDPTDLANERATSMTCTITSTTPRIMFEQDGYNGNVDSLPWRWSMETFIGTDVPSEDTRTGDSYISTHKTPLMNDGTKLGAFHQINDNDYYTIPIQHGATQTIELESKGRVQYSLSESDNCFSEASFVNGSSIYTYKVLMICDTENMTDEIHLTVASLESAHEHTWPHYSIMTASDLKAKFQSFLSNNSLEPDVSSISGATILAKDQTYNGTFLYASDTIDRFVLDIQVDEQIELVLKSNCARIHTMKHSFVDVLTYRYGQVNSWNSLMSIDTSLPGAPVHTIDVQRLHQTGSTDLYLKKPCHYSLTYTDGEPGPYSNVPISHSLRLSEGQTLVLDSFDHEMAGVSDEQILSYQATFPLDLSPLKDGMIRVEQASNQPVDLVLTRSSYSPSLKNVLATNETEFGQTIDFGFDYIQWNHVHLSGLDGSSLTITMEETTLSQQSTQESGELYSGGQGRLGMSMDEGWDVEDVWEFNNTEFATYYSVLLIDEEGTLDASLSSGSTKQVSQLRCEQHLTYLPEPGSGFFAPIQVSHREGSGQYTLEVQRGFAETCPSDVTIMAPNTISVDSDFRVKYESTIAYDVTMNIIDEELSLVYSTQIMDSGVWYPIIDLPDLTPGAYTLIARGHDNVVVAEQPLTILSDPLITTYVTAGDLDLIQTPKIFVNSHSPHSYVPQDWIMEDIVVSGVGADENLFSLEYGSSYEGTGSGIVVLDQLPPLLSGSQLIATATISSGNTFANHSWFWHVGFIQPTTTCQTDYTISFQRPQNQLLCSVDFSLTTHGSAPQTRTEESFSGRLEVYNANGTMVADVKFQSDRFAPTPVRIDFNEIREPGTYQTSLVMDDNANYYFTESTAEFNVNGYLSVEVESTPIGDFDFSLLPVRDRATAGDKVTFLWSSEGQTPDYLFVDVYTDYLQDDQELVYSKTVLLDGVNSGELQLTLPESVNPFLDHMIQVTAISEYGEAAVEYNELQGLPELSNLEVYINPTNPTIGDEFDVIVSNPSGGNWLSWEWELRLESSVIGSGNGFDEANKATISVDLPLAQYSSNPMFYISVETVDGTVHDITRTVNPLPMRTVQVEFKDSMVVGEEAEFEWRLEGIYLNQMDNIQKIDVVLYSLTNNLVHQEQYFGNATSGRESVLLPESINPGTYNVVIRFSFADGTDYSHIETAQVLAEPEGINVLGITIPPLMMGLDTLLVIGLLIHAVLLQRRMKSSDEDEVGDVSSADDVFEDEYTMPLLDDLDGQQADANHLDELERNDWTNANNEVGSSEVDTSNPDLYQEYPEGSGRFWSRNSVDDQWELVD